MEYTEVLQQNTSASLKSLKAKNAVLDAVNSEIFKARINTNSTELILNRAHITRFPVTLFQTAGYADFWQHLDYLDCSNNQLTELNVQGLPALEWLYCYNNQLTELNLQKLSALQKLSCQNNQLTVLNLQGLRAVQVLECNNNQLTELNVQGLPALQQLNCRENPLTNLNLADVPVAIKNEYAELERSLLLNQLSQAGSIKARQTIIDRLGAADTLSSFSAYLPSSGASNNTPNAQQKRTRDEEEQIQDDNQMEQEEKELGDEPDAKLRKTS